MSLFNLTDEDLETAKNLLNETNTKEAEEKRELETRKLEAKNNEFNQKKQKQENPVVKTENKNIKKPVEEKPEQQAAKPDVKLDEVAPAPEIKKTISTETPLDYFRTAQQNNIDLSSSAFISQMGNFKFTSDVKVNLDFKNIDFTGPNLVGNFTAAVAKGLSGIHGIPGENNYVPELDKYLPKGMSSMSGEPWCAMFVSGCIHQMGIHINELSPGANLDVILPKSAGALDLRRQFADANAISKLPKIGDVMFKTREGGGHCGVVESCDIRTGDFVTLEGNMGSGDKVMRVHHNLYAMMKTGEFMGFGDINELIKNKKPELYNYLENKNTGENMALNNSSLPLVAKIKTTCNTPSHA